MFDLCSVVRYFVFFLVLQSFYEKARACFFALFL